MFTRFLIKSVLFSGRKNVFLSQSTLEAIKEETLVIQYVWLPSAGG